MQTNKLQLITRVQQNINYIEILRIMRNSNNRFPLIRNYFHSIDNMNNLYSNRKTRDEKLLLLFST